jgi:hypothetical protein
VTEGTANIRPATPEDYPAIAALLDGIFGAIPYEKRLKLWRWRYDDNPIRSDEIPPFLVADKNGRIVGVHGLVPLNLKAGDRQFRISCSCDLAVDQSARSVGMKLKLAALSKNISPLHVSTSANEPAYRITLALGGKELRSGRRKLLKILNVKGLLRKSLGSKGGRLRQIVAKLIGIVAGVPADWILSISRSCRRLPKESNAVIRNLDEFDRSFDDFWKRIAQEYRILFVRDTSYLNWRYIRYPFEGIRSFALLNNGEIEGFAVIHDSIDEDGLPFTAILELVVSRGNKAAFELLLGEVINRSAIAGRHYITARTSIPEWESLFLRRGFRMREAEISPYTYKNNTDLPDDVFAKEEDWFTSLGDGDGCYYID